MYNSFEFLHNVSVTRIFKKHICLLLDRLQMFPISIGDVILDDLVVGEEEIIEALVTVSNVPCNDSSLLHDPDELGESLGDDGAGEHAGTAE